MNNIKLFQDKKIRSIWNEEEQQWYFSVVHVIEALTDSADPKQYIKQMRSNDSRRWKKEENPSCTYKRIIPYYTVHPFPKAEPFKLWLVQVGYERVQEIENPKLAQERMKALYEQKGYPKDWIDKRLRGIAIRQNLTDEWKEREVTEKSAYAILTAEISKGTFGLTPSSYKAYKGLTKKIRVW